jgi:membrane protein YdbS with pleckstrin-like domain
MAQIDKEYFNVEESIKQNKVEDILGEGEEVLVSLKPNRKVYILESIFKGLPVTLLWAGVDAFAIYMIISSGAFADSGMIIFFIVFFGLHLIPVWFYIASIIKKVAGYKNISYTFTDKRIIVRSGLIGIDFRYLYYPDIDSVNAKVGIFDRLFKVGDIHIQGVSQHIVVEDVSAPYIYADKIQTIVRDLKADMNFPNDLRPEENHGYNTKYKAK